MNLTDRPNDYPETRLHPSLNAIDPHTGGVTTIWTIRCCSLCEPGLVADGATPERCREHEGDLRIQSTCSGQPSMRDRHEPMHNRILARATASFQCDAEPEPAMTAFHRKDAQ